MTTSIATIPAPKPASSQGDALAKFSQDHPGVLDAALTTKREELDALQQDTTMPEHLRQTVKNLVELSSSSRQGLEEVPSYWSIPRISIAQPMTDSKPSASKNGDIITSSGQILKGPLKFILLYLNTENVHFAKAGGGDGKKMLCQAIDGKLGSHFGECDKCPHLPFGAQNGGRGEQKHTSCYRNIVAHILTVDDPMVYKVQFGKTSYKAGSALLQLARQQPALWKQPYLLSTEKKSGDLGVYWTYVTQATGENNSEHEMKLCSHLYGLYNANRQLQLSEWYLRTLKAPGIAAAAEHEFQAGMLDTGLATEGVEPLDLNDPVKPIGASGTKSARSSSKPM